MSSAVMEKTVSRTDSQDDTNSSALGMLSWRHLNEDVEQKVVYMNLEFRSEAELSYCL